MLVILVAYTSQYARANPCVASRGRGQRLVDAARRVSRSTVISILTNDYTACGRADMIVDQGGSRPANSFYFGPASSGRRSSSSFATSFVCLFTDRRHGGVCSVRTLSRDFALLLCSPYGAARVSRRPALGEPAMRSPARSSVRSGATLVTYGAPVWFSHLLVGLQRCHRDAHLRPCDGAPRKQFALGSVRSRRGVRAGAAQSVDQPGGRLLGELREDASGLKRVAAPPGDHAGQWVCEPLLEFSSSVYRRSTASAGSCRKASSGFSSGISTHS